jgi:hypothetical protein
MTKLAKCITAKDFFYHERKPYSLSKHYIAAASDNDK